MPKYKVQLVETVRYEVEVEAENEDDAADLACEMWAQSQDSTNDFCGMGEGVEVADVDELDTA